MNERFDDIAGYRAEKKELADIVGRFKKYKEYEAKGVYLPKGLMLTGSPGTGKTLFARVLANEIGAHFFEFKAKTNFFMSGATKLKKCFKKAKGTPPSIIFIDEIDKYLSSQYYTSDQSNSFQAALLTCIDGFSPADGIMVVCATSDDSELPPTLLRSGRMDIHICIPLPSKNDRAEIIKYYLDKINASQDVQIETIAAKTSNFSGADLKTLVNQSCAKAIVRGKRKVITEDFFDSIHDIYFQDIKRSNETINKEYIAIHEIGHLVVGYKLLRLKGDIDIDSHGDSLGSTFFEDCYAAEDELLDDNDEIDCDEEFGKDGVGRCINLHGRDYYLNLVCSLLGGMAAEEVRYGSSLAGNASDINKAISIIHNLLATGCYGFAYLNFDLANDGQTSEQTVYAMEKKVTEILDECYQKTRIVIQNNQPLIKELLKIMEQKNLMTSEESDCVFDRFERETLDVDGGKNRNNSSN